MKRPTLRLSFFAALLVCVVAGCGGDGGAETDGGRPAPVGPFTLEPKVVEVSALPKLEPNALPVQDEGRVEVTTPEGWVPMSRHTKFVARFKPQGVSGAAPPRIMITAADAPGDPPASLTAKDAKKFEAYMKPVLKAELKGRKDIREQPRTLIIGDQPWARYVLGRSHVGMAVDAQVLKTVANGRMYTMELEVYHQENVLPHRDQAYAIAAGMKFLKVESGGGDELGDLFTGDGDDDGEDGGEDGDQDDGGEEAAGDETDN